MSAIKQIISTCYFESAKRLRHCSRNKKHLISKNEKCFVVKEQMNKKSYCMECALIILNKAKQDINELYDQCD